MEIQGGKFLTFLWGQEVYGIPIKKVKEDHWDELKLPGYKIPKVQDTSKESLTYGVSLFPSWICGSSSVSKRKSRIMNMLVLSY